MPFRTGFRGDKEERHCERTHTHTYVYIYDDEMMYDTLFAGLEHDGRDTYLSFLNELEKQDDEIFIHA
jgi:hypothetical protein